MRNSVAEEGGFPSPPPTDVPAAESGDEAEPAEKDLFSSDEEDAELSADEYVATGREDLIQPGPAVVGAAQQLVETMKQSHREGSEWYKCTCDASPFWVCWLTSL